MMHAGQVDAPRIKVAKRASGDVVMLHEFVTVNRRAIIARYRTKAQRRCPRLVNTAAIDEGVGPFLAQLVHELRPGLASPCEITKMATAEAHDLLGRGFTISQVVHHYTDLGHTIAELAIAEDAPIGVDDGGVLDRCVADAIAGAITVYRRARQVPTTMPAAPTRDDRLALLGRELRGSVHTARVALRGIKSERVGVVGSTGAVIDRHLLDAHDLIDRLLGVERPIDPGLY
jgi:hypothetical protein